VKNASDNTFLRLLNPLYLGTIFYILFSSVFLVIRSSHVPDLWDHVVMRIIILVSIPGILILNEKFPNKVTLLLKSAYPLFFLNNFYSETAYLKNVIFPADLDVYFANAEQWLFGCQPSLEFSKLMPNDWFKELMFMSYFSYYPMIGAFCLGIFFLSYKEAPKAICLMVFSFYLYYMIYIILPVIGPQYYFNSSAYQADLPYFFGKTMYLLHPLENATGAFPSSHVGLALVMCYLAFKHVKKLFFILFPFALGICFATVYVKEHYLIDVLAGMVSGPLFLLISNFIYNKLSRFYSSLIGG
jgi:membrane-associated phospholipid phosphatase